MRGATKFNAARKAVMADSDAHYSDQTPIERAARYWKSAADAYHRACNADALEVRQFYIQMAMASAALAAELERVPDHAQSSRYNSINDRSPTM